MNATKGAVPESRRRWGVGRIVVVVVIVALVIFGGLMIIGLATPVETLVATVAEEHNEKRGTMVDSITRFDVAIAEGPALVVRYTLMDDWYDEMIREFGQEWEEVLGREPGREWVLSMMEAGVLEDACKVREEELLKPEARAIFDYRDERGEQLMAVEASASTC